MSLNIPRNQQWQLTQQSLPTLATAFDINAGVLEEKRQSAHSTASASTAGKFRPKSDNKAVSYRNPSISALKYEIDGKIFKQYMLNGKLYLMNIQKMRRPKNPTCKRLTADQSTTYSREKTATLPST